jgi:hypothetical protein
MWLPFLADRSCWRTWSIGFLEWGAVWVGSVQLFALDFELADGLLLGGQWLDDARLPKLLGTELRELASDGRLAQLHVPADFADAEVLMADHLYDQRAAKNLPFDGNVSCGLGVQFGLVVPSRNTGQASLASQLIAWSTSNLVFSYIKLRKLPDVYRTPSGNGAIKSSSPPMASMWLRSVDKYMLVRRSSLATHGY